MDDKLNHLLERTLHLFYQYGIRSLSMDDISRHLAISKKTLYQYVGSKDELVKKVMDMQSEKNRGYYESVITSAGNAIDKLLDASKYLNQQLRIFNPVMMFDLHKFHPETVSCHLEEERGYFVEKMRDNLLQGIGEGLFRPGLNVDLVALLFVSNLAELHRLDEVLASKITFSDIFQVMFENYIRGIGTPSGIEYFEKEMESIDFTM
jgi:AcrR family transcriptional regulator